MARIRTIKPEFWRDEALSEVSAEAALLAVGLLNYCDDEGYFNANPRLVQSDIFPLRDLSVTTTVLLRELYEIGYVQVFSSPDGKMYGKVKNFEKHQVINKKNASKIREIEGLKEVREDYGSTTVVLPHGKERKGKGKEYTYFVSADSRPLDENEKLDENDKNEYSQNAVKRTENCTPIVEHAQGTLNSTTRQQIGKNGTSVQSSNTQNAVQSASGTEADSEGLHEETLRDKYGSTTVVVNLAVRFEQILARLRYADAKSKASILGEVYALCYGEQKEMPYARLMTLAKEYGGAGQLAQAMFDTVSKRLTDDPLDYLTKAIKAKQHGRITTVARGVAKPISEFNNTESVITG